MENKADNNTFGIIVDDVSRVVRIPEEEIKEAPSIITEKIHADYIKGVAVLDDRLIILLEPDKIYSEEELVEMGSTEEVEKKEAEKEVRKKAEKEKIEKTPKEKKKSKKR